ncbi:hypothetical protein LTR95_002418 [Oleoguttula sp. CCFEE 5521]
MATSSTPTSTACTLTDRIPPEIRREIFSYLLVRDDQIEFRPKYSDHASGMRETHWTSRNHGRWRERSGERIFDERKTLSPHGTAILRICKLVTREAGEVLYSCNVFRFSNLRCAGGFLGELGDLNSAIRHVILERFEGGSTLVHGFWTGLLPLVNLRSLRLPHDVMCKAHRSKISMRTLQCRILPLLKGIRDSNAQKGIIFDSVKVLQTPQDICHACCRDAEGKYRWCDRDYRENEGFIAENTMAPRKRSKKSKTNDIAPATTPPSTTTMAPQICFLLDRLPIEIRKDIFSYVLTKQWPIQFAVVRPSGKGSGKYVQRFHNRNSKHPGQVYDPKTKTWIQAPLIITALLQTCKQIHAEGSEAFYGCNEFQFKTTSVATGWLTTFEGPKHAIKKVDIGGDLTTKAAKEFWKALPSLVNLRILTLEHIHMCPKSLSKSITLAALQRELTPFLKVLKESYKRQGFAANAADVLHISNYRCWGCMCTCGKAPKCRAACTDSMDWEENYAVFQVGHAALVKTVGAAMRETVAELGD